MRLESPPAMGCVGELAHLAAGSMCMHTAPSPHRGLSPHPKLKETRPLGLRAATRVSHCENDCLNLDHVIGWWA